MTSIIKGGMKILIHFQIATVQLLKMGWARELHPTLNWVCGYVSMLGLNSIHKNTNRHTAHTIVS